MLKESASDLTDCLKREKARHVVGNGRRLRRHAPRTAVRVSPSKSPILFRSEFLFDFSESELASDSWHRFLLIGQSKH